MANPISSLFLTKIYSSAILHVALFVLLSGSVHNNRHIGIANSYSTDQKCNNTLITWIDRNNISVTDDHTLDKFWNTCTRSISANSGTTPNLDTSQLCQATRFNLGLLCNKDIAEAKLKSIQDIWKSPYNRNPICQDMQNDVYDLGKICKQYNDQEVQDGCNANREVIASITSINGGGICKLCTLDVRGNDNMCVSLWRVWQTLILLSENKQMEHSQLSAEEENGMTETEDLQKRNLVPPDGFLGGFTQHSMENQNPDKIGRNQPEEPNSNNIFNGQEFPYAKPDSSKANRQRFNPKIDKDSAQPNVNLIKNKLKDDVAVSLLELITPKSVQKKQLPLPGHGDNRTNLSPSVEPNVTNKDNVLGAEQNVPALSQVVKEEANHNNKGNAETIEENPDIDPTKYDDNKDAAQKANDVDSGNEDLEEAHNLPADSRDGGNGDNQILHPETENKQGAKSTPEVKKQEEDNLQHDADNSDKITNNVVEDPLKANENIMDEEEHNDPIESPDQGINEPPNPGPPNDEVNGVNAHGNEQQPKNKPEKLNASNIDIHMNGNVDKDPRSSNFISYFFVISLLTVCVYLIFYNKKKLIALMLEGRRGRNGSRRSRSGSKSGRSSSAQYRKLDNNLEEAMGPSSSTSFREVIY